MRDGSGGERRESQLGQSTCYLVKFVHKKLRSMHLVAPNLYHAARFSLLLITYSTQKQGK